MVGGVGVTTPQTPLVAALTNKSYISSMWWLCCDAPPHVLVCSDGGYSEHGREIFDEEVDPVPKSKQGGPKKPVSLNVK